MQQVRADTLRVSVVVPAYNAEVFIRETLDSILAQTRPVDEVVVVDDGSTDDTIEIVNSFASAGVRIVQQQRQGPSAARNRGIAETSGELVAFLDADDLWMPDKIEKQIAYLVAHPECGMVTCDMVWWNIVRGSRRIVKRGVRPGGDQRREIAVSNFVGNPSQVLAWRRLLEQVGGFGAQQRWCEDWELWTRMIHQQPLGVVHEPLITYRWHSGGNTHDKRWEQSSIFFDVARRAISRVQPAWWRPLLLLRAWGAVQMQRAEYAIDHEMPRYQQIRYALLAFVCAPFDKTSTKLRHVVQAFFGKQLFHRVRRRFKQRPTVSARLR